MYHRNMFLLFLNYAPFFPNLEPPAYFYSFIILVSRLSNNGSLLLKKTTTLLLHMTRRFLFTKGWQKPIRYNFHYSKPETLTQATPFIWPYFPRTAILRPIRRARKTSSLSLSIMRSIPVNLVGLMLL